jgi:hypothetical protein
MQVITPELLSGSAQCIGWSVVTSPWTSPLTNGGPNIFWTLKLGRSLSSFTVVGMNLSASTVTAGQCAGPRTLPVIASEISYAHTRVTG